MLDEGLVDELVQIPAWDYTKPEGEHSNFPRQFDNDGLPIMYDGRQVGWSDEALLERKRIVGKDQWARVYMQEPLSSSGACVTEEHLVAATSTTRRLGIPAGVGVMATLDPALAGYAGYIVCGFDAEKMYVMDLLNYKAPERHENLFAEIDRLSALYRPSYWVIEDNTLQSGYLLDDRFLELKAKYGFQATGRHTGKAKTDRLLGVPAMMNAIVAREIEFPIVTPEDVDLAELLDQLLAWRQDIPTKMLRQDLVVALYFAWQLWRELRGNINQDLSGWQRAFLANPTHYAGASVDLTMRPASPVAQVKETYEQQWARLARGG
jgi:hypothetical protein